MNRLAFPSPAGRALPVAAAVLALFLAGCADMSGIGSTAKLRDADSLGLQRAVAQHEGTLAANPVDSRWWTGFGNPQLNALIDEALAGNPNLAVAQARLTRARAAIATAEAADRPQVNGAFDASRQRFSNTYIYPPPLGGSIQETGTLQLNGSWELDFFGKNRAALDSAMGTANAAAAEADASRVLLASNVARGYVQWARLNEQLIVAKRTLAQREETLKLVRDRVSAGLDTRLELRQSEGGLPEARQQIESLDEQIALAQHALDALVARPGAAQALTPPSLASLHAIALQSDLPADLLGRRADIAAARWRVEAASGDVAGAKTLFYPNVSLTAFVGTQSLGLDNLLKSDSRQWGFGPAIRLPIFEGGRLRANLRGKAADLDAAIESYNASVLDAVRDAADQVSSAQSVGRQQLQQRDAQAAAEGAYEIAVQRYRAGLGNYLNVLTAETAVLAQRRLAVDLAARALETQVGLARALGGGWQPGVAVAGAAPTHP
ncbi:MULTISPECIES: efflux transporter outer membrane subunit [unclassified Variovorax]|uniref:efflux transporter outer membrane subunit n=1 Tax=unclassified Variovorax TaxID=663243 RepID=UPI00257740ED|nr:MULTISPECIES: efflux transporter outer membrane subunit [unclassified Variovorax]MDM0085860.1 efflux transporter outer membrane subunit [Variovorax sp. J22G40]MDM0145882.1 efflux transporter outer membrane subunit [Variovorax sp. J2P1-31]